MEGAGARSGPKGPGSAQVAVFPRRRRNWWPELRGRGGGGVRGGHGDLQNKVY